MDNKIYPLLGALVLLASCSVEEQALPEQVIITSPPPPSYPVTTSTAIILKKRLLPHNREEYHARLANGQEMTFTVDIPAHYQVGDLITLPQE